MPKYNYFECLECHEQIKGKRNLFNHMIEFHNYVNEIHAIAKFYNQELGKDGHFHCKVCGKEIPDAKICSAIIDKGKTFVSSFCSQKCSIEGFNKLGLEKAHENLKIQMDKHKQGEPSQYDKFFTCGHETWEKARKDPEKFERMSKGLKFGRDIARGKYPEIRRIVLIKKLSRKEQISKLYIVKAKIDDKVVVKVGIGDPWRRWKCISLLIPNLIIEELLETLEPLRNSELIEFELHQDLKSFNIKDQIPNITRKFIQGGYIFNQSTAPTEWYSENAFNEAVELATNKYHLDLKSSLKGFKEYLKEENVKLNE